MRRSVDLYVQKKGRIACIRPRADRVYGGPSAERAAQAEMVRRALIARIDDLAADSIMPVAMREFGLDGDQWIQLLQMIQLKLFPEEFGEREEGLVPKSGRLARVDGVAWEHFAKAMTGE